MFCTQDRLTIVEADLVVGVGPVLHQHALGLVGEEGHFGSLGTHHADKLADVLVLLPVAAGQVVVRVTGM